MEGNTCNGTTRCACANPDCMIRRGVDMKALLSVPVKPDVDDKGPPPDCVGACHGLRVDDAARLRYDHGHP